MNTKGNRDERSLQNLPDSRVWNLDGVTVTGTETRIAQIKRLLETR